MIARLIRWSTVNRPLVLLVTLLAVGWGIYAVRHTPLDAIPDLSDVQVIIKTAFPGQAPQVMEDQVTYPLTTAMLAVPGAVHVRGYSFFGESYVYVIFEDGTDPYWARSRVLEYLSQAREQLPPGARTQLGPDASGVGWIYQYALVDRTGRHDLAELRSLQDWFLRFELQTVPGVAEVASRRRHGQAVPGRARSGTHARPRAVIVRDPPDDSRRQPGGERLGHRDGRGGVSHPRQGLHQEPGRPQAHSVSHSPRGRGRAAAAGYRRHPPRSADAPRHRRSGRPGRGRGRHRRHALGRQCPDHHRTGQGQTRAAEKKSARRRGDRRDLRPLGADHARGGDAQAPPDRGVHSRGPRLRRVPVSSAFIAGGGVHPARGHARGLRRHASAGHQRQHHVARAASPSRSAPWWTPRS